MILQGKVALVTGGTTELAEQRRSRSVLRVQSCVLRQTRCRTRNNFCDDETGQVFVCAIGCIEVNQRLRR